MWIINLASSAGMVVEHLFLQVSTTYEGSFVRLPELLFNKLLSTPNIFINVKRLFWK